MNDLQWNIFVDFKKEFKEKVSQWVNVAPELKELQKSAVEKAKAPLYPFETTVVYNKALDEVKKTDDIKLIVIGDNPGKDEQLIKNNKYLVGQAGKIAEGYFKRNSELGIDFRQNVIILNKTPIHSGKTAQLKTIAKEGGEKIVSLLEESQSWMAKRTAKLHIDLCNAAKDNGYEPELWLVGYSELKEKGIFLTYKNTLKNFYKENNEEKQWNKVYVFQHFSMNRFSIDLGKYVTEKKDKNYSLIENIHEIGNIHKKEIFG